MILTLSLHDCLITRSIIPHHKPLIISHRQLCYNCAAAHWVCSVEELVQVAWTGLWVSLCCMILCSNQDSFVLFYCSTWLLQPACLWDMAATVCGIWLLLSVGYGCYCLWDMAATVCGIWLLLSVGYGCYCLWDMAATVCGIWLLLSCPYYHRAVRWMKVLH